jgi:hypothetical protein
MKAGRRVSGEASKQQHDVSNSPLSQQARTAAYQLTVLRAYARIIFR